MAFVFALLAVAAVPGVARYVVLPVRSPLTPDTAIGPLKAGVACVRAGTLRWSDVRLNGEQAAMALADALAGQGIGTRPYDPLMDDGAPNPPRLSAEIVAISGQVCRPNYNMLRLSRTGSKGDGSMTVRWRIRDVIAGGAIQEISTTADFAFTDRSKSLEAFVRAGLAANAPLFAHRVGGSLP